MFFRHLTGRLLGFSRKHGRISRGALEESSSKNSREINPRVSANAINLHAFTIPFREADEITALS
jgi:hypothetical protein